MSQEMSLKLSCDICDEEATFFGVDQEECKTQAEKDFWYLGLDEDLCPTCRRGA